MSIWKKIDKKFAIKGDINKDKELFALQDGRNMSIVFFGICLLFELGSLVLDPEATGGRMRNRGVVHLLPYAQIMFVGLGLFFLISGQMEIFKLLKKRRDQDSYGD